MTAGIYESQLHLSQQSSSSPSIAASGAATSTVQAPVRTHRVLKIAPTSFFADYGCHVRIYEESRILRKLGHKVTICTYHTGRDLDGLDIRRAFNTPWQQGVQVGSNLHKLYYDGLLGLKVAQVALQVRPTVIHAHLHEGALIGYPISRLLRVPLIFDFQGSLTSEMLDHRFLRPDSPLFKPLLKLEGLINHMADKIIASSQNAAELLVNDFQYPAHKVMTLADSVDTDIFVPRALREDPEALVRLRRRLQIPEERCLVVYLGLLAGYQGTDKLLEAAALLVAKGLPVHFLIMGFPGEDAYRTQAEQMGLADYVTFTGQIPYQEAPVYLALGDIAISPKMSETEGNGKLLNYMAVGLPTVTFNTPVARELLGDLGVYARPGDSGDLARALEQLILNEDFRIQRGCELRTRAEQHFSWEATGRRLMEVYDSVSR